jgi:hypothetical protein
MRTLNLFEKWAANLVGQRHFASETLEMAGFPD